MNFKHQLDNQKRRREEYFELSTQIIYAVAEALPEYADEIDIDEYSPHIFWQLPYVVFCYQYNSNSFFYARPFSGPEYVKIEDVFRWIREDLPEIYRDIREEWDAK